MTYIDINADDGRTFQAYYSGNNKKLPCIILIQEIFGVNQVMRDLSDKSRDQSPLILSKDSIILNTEFLNPNEVLNKALSFIKKSK